MLRSKKKAFLLLMLVAGLMLMLMLGRYRKHPSSLTPHLWNVVYVGAMEYWQTRSHSDADSTSVYESSFHAALTAVADEKKLVILAMVDTGYVDMAVNFYETSIRPHNLTQLLFVSVVTQACDDLKAYQLPCFTFLNDNHTADSNYMSKAFLGKMNVRTNFIYQALQLGFSILQVDIDLIFMKNPLPSFSCEKCAIESMQDGIKNYINCGYVLLKARPETITVYKAMVKRAKVKPMSEDQRNLNKFVHQYKIKYQVLPPNTFQCGVNYYEHPKRYFADTAKACTGCMVIHNNWIVSRQAKVYRFKEMLQWMVDRDYYYTSASRKYLTYVNPDEKKFYDDEKKALVNGLAMAQILNRTLILPKFHCGKSLCALNNFVYLKHFDPHFDYREHMYLQHPKVPSIIKSGVSESYTISSKADGGKFTPQDLSAGATEKEIVDWFGDLSVPVLKFTQLYSSFKGFTNETIQNEFNGRVKNGLVKAGYRQY